MEIQVIGRELINGVLNLKQYSSGVYSFSFVFDRLPVALGGASALLAIDFAGDIKSYEMTLLEKDGIVTAVWEPIKSVTNTAGAFDYQITIIGDDIIWRSFKSLIVISRSVTDTLPAPEVGGIIAGIPEFEAVKTCCLPYIFSTLEVIESTE